MENHSEPITLTIDDTKINLDRNILEKCGLLKNIMNNNMKESMTGVIDIRLPDGINFDIFLLMIEQLMHQEINVTTEQLLRLILCKQYFLVDHHDDFQYLAECDYITDDLAILFEIMRTNNNKLIRRIIYGLIPKNLDTKCIPDDIQLKGEVFDMLIAEDSGQLYIYLIDDNYLVPYKKIKINGQITRFDKHCISFEKNNKNFYYDTLRFKLERSNFKMIIMPSFYLYQLRDERNQVIFSDEYIAEYRFEHMAIYNKDYQTIREYSHLLFDYPLDYECDMIYSAEFSSNGMLVYWNECGIVLFGSVTEKGLINKKIISEKQFQYLNVCFNSDGEYLIAFCVDRCSRFMIIYSTKKLNKVAMFSLFEFGIIHDIDYHPSKTDYIFFSDSNNLCCFNIFTGNYSTILDRCQPFMTVKNKFPRVKFNN